MKNQIQKLTLILFMSIISQFLNIFNNQAIAKSVDFYQFNFKQFDGKDLKLKTFQGKVILVVNTASKCGFTKQYSGLEKLYKKYQEQGLVIIAIPSQDFGGQEFEKDEEIQNFCKYNYGLSFPVARKETVIGDKAHPFFIEAKKTLGFGSSPKWNFHKYLINRNGNLVDFFNSTTSPEDEKLINKIEQLLNEKKS
jgi:glutathione peroxidase